VDQVLFEVARLGSVEALADQQDHEEHEEDQERVEYESEQTKDYVHQPWPRT